MAKECLTKLVPTVIIVAIFGKISSNHFKMVGVVPEVFTYTNLHVFIIILSGKGEDLTSLVFVAHTTRKIDQNYKVCVW